ncbi:MAG: class I SAM-dependent methyltransferase [Promethearchaeota archaeon]|nr:MAG: class I SAM-dependent methyltransferase [Candidatus Lokiarchaeota archaeon]
MPKNKKHEHYYTKSPKSEIKFKMIQYTIFNRAYTFRTATGVFSYKRVDKGTEILLKNMILPDIVEPKILDLGCGYGIIGIVIADLIPTAKVYMVDINNRAINLCKKNVTLNNSDNVILRSGDLFQPFNEQFDLIITNPPIALGKEILHKIFKNSFLNLKVGGSFQTVIRTKQGAKSAVNKIKQIFGDNNVELLNIKSGYRVFKACKTKDIKI